MTQNLRETLPRRGRFDVKTGTLVLFSHENVRVRRADRREAAIDRAANTRGQALRHTQPLLALTIEKPLTPYIIARVFHIFLLRCHVCVAFFFSGAVRRCVSLY